jgi:hypothetical protein
MAMPEQNNSRPGSIDWLLLNEAIRRGKCILVLGPDAALDPAARAGPLSARLAASLAEEIGERAGIIDPTDLAHVSQLYYSAVGSRLKLETRVREFLTPFQSATTDLHRNLASIPFRICVNLGLDRFLNNALKETGKQPVADYYNFRSLRSGPLDTPDEQAPLVFNLFGAVDDLESVILTEQDMLEFLVKIVTRDPPLQAMLASQLADKENSFLFIGFRFDSWHARVLLHVLKTYDHSEPSLGLINAGAFGSAEDRCAEVYFRQAHKFDFDDMSPLEFSRKLKRRFRAGQAPEVAEIRPPAGAPTVFLCYRRGDLDAVVQVEQTLHRSGIDTWRDVQNLRGGDDWNRVIHDVLRKQADYVVVLQTPDMVNEVKSYCKREIDVALDEQKAYGDFKYLIPAVLKACQGFERLSHLQSADLTRVGGLDRLIETLKADWTRRQEVEHGREIA